MNDATIEAIALEITKAKFANNSKLNPTSSYDWVKTYNDSLKEVKSEIKRKSNPVGNVRVRLPY
ncbi:hypothetical protein [Acinetobacter pollinis]|uniref:hypothetical protein n=1 Tax=Acinetobacter pollinis TaxID=2605270 RepID=UPI0018A2F268|nr:hypothetical protein [Acinetobacter pollinis]MBF7691564.1 hypothetical protein [Acinetobacter pollinis]MBF7699254.1 hypothetical protein [Acinetobacter pollinis]